MTENSCVVCFKNFRIFSVGECDHPVCFECSARMRVLCCQKECPMCRHEMEMVVFTEKVRPFKRLKKTYGLYDTQYHIAFENDYIKDVFESLLHYVCQKCHRGPIFDTFEYLKEHMRRVHDLYCCDLCADNLKIFPCEMRYYTKQELSRHKRVGDVDNRSHRGHPLCEFCEVRYLDKDELYRHLRKEHYFCHICDSEGIQQFYGTYPVLRDHYRDKHYLCEEGDCIQESMTSVFPTKIDLQTHKALVHYKNLRNKQAVRQARTLELEFPLPPRNSDRRARYGQEGEDFSGNQIQSNQAQDTDVNIMASLEQDFPTLGNSSYHAPRPKMTRESNNRLVINDQNFPALGSEASIKLNITNSVDGRPSTSDSITSTNISVQLNHKKAKEKKPKNGLQCNCAPSTSMLSLTWVQKAKEKKTVPERTAVSSAAQSEYSTKPPTMNRQNFPNLQKNGHENTCPSSSSNKVAKKNKKSPSGGPSETNGSDLAGTRSNYSEVIVRNGNVKEEKTKNRSKAAGNTSKAKDTKEERSASLNKDNKTHSFLLNANRKKVKMKPEQLIPLNESSRSQALLPRATSSSKADSKTEDRNVDTVKYNGAHCDRRGKDVDGKMKDSERKTKVKEKRERQEPQIKGNEPKKAQPAMSSTKDSGLKKNSKSEAKKKTKSVASREEPTPSAISGKPPPGFEKPTTLPLPPPGFNALTRGETTSKGEPAIKNDTNSLMNGELLADALFVYQEPDEFATRNSQLLEKIGSSLVEQSEEALNEFKNMSLLFREGFLLASDYYLYCMKNIKEDNFENVFIDLVALLPDIFKQQELWAIYQSTMPSNVQDSESLIDYCTICFQILKLDDAVFHYAKHGITSDTLLQFSSLA